uniref:Uncharacterized protein n=1 Tax=Oryza nivara TaxID=4536 RepID=A0A0E0I6S0_ORYNI
MATDAAAEAVAIHVEDELNKAAEKVAADISRLETKIHRIPANMLDLANDGMHYFVPNVVAIGPYHHGLPHLLEAEDVKRAAAYYFCRGSGHSAMVVYEKILSVAGEARSCYADDAVAGIPDADFATMMFHDGCFLLYFIMSYTISNIDQLDSWLKPKLASILMDIFLLENQIPWLVLDALMVMDLRSVPLRVHKFIVLIARTLSNVISIQENPDFILDGSFTWPHLLGLLRCYVSGGMIEEEHIKFPREVTSFSLTSSAIELEEIGIKLKTSRTTEFKLNHMGIEKGCLFGKLFLTPFVLDEVRACWLLNMAALEVSIANFSDASCTGVSSYVAVLAMLMNKEEDVHKLRAKGLLHGKFSDQETLKFFKSLVKRIYVGPGYTRILVELEAYKRNRWMWIHIHKFVYNKFKTIVTVFSIIVSVVGVLVAVFKILLSMKQHQH